MARRGSGYGDGTDVGIFICVVIALWFVFPIITAVIVYGTFTDLVLGLIVSEYRARPRPAITSEKQLKALDGLSCDEKSAICSLVDQEKELFRQKVELYWEGDQSGLVRRQSDSRFDARRGGRSLNTRLAKLDTVFEAVEYEIASIKLNSVQRSQQQADEFAEWRIKNATAVAFRSALGAYIICAAGLTIYNPPWLQQVSQFIAQHVWLYISWLAAIYGSVVIASVVAIAVVVAIAIFVVLFWNSRRETWIMEYQTD
jgi:hypothetical protein